MASSAGLGRRSFLKGAALSLLGLAAFGCSSRNAFAAKASDATLAALDAAQAEYDVAVATLSQIGNELEEAQYQLSQCQAELAATEQQIADLEASILQKQAELSEAQDILADRLRANYIAGNTEMLDVLLSAADFDDFVSRLYYATKVSDADAEAIENVRAIKAELEAQQAALNEQRAIQEQLVVEQQARADELQATVEYYEAYTANLSSEVQALMAQAQAEYEAAARAEYEAQQAALEAARAEADAAANGNAGSGGDSGGGSYEEGGSSGGSSSGGSSSSGGGSSVGAGGNHVGGVAGVAWNYIGVPYVWGGTTPSGFDCSGLAQYCYAQCGYSISRDTYGQAANIAARGQTVYSMSQCYAGDLVFPHGGHVGIYQGGGMWIHAPAPGRSVEYSSVYAFSFGGCPV